MTEPELCGCSSASARHLHGEELSAALAVPGLWQHLWMHGISGAGSWHTLQEDERRSLAYHVVGGNNVTVP